MFSISISINCFIILCIFLLFDRISLIFLLFFGKRICLKTVLAFLVLLIVFLFENNFMSLSFTLLKDADLKLSLLFFEEDKLFIFFKYIKIFSPVLFSLFLLTPFKTL